MNKAAPDMAGGLKHRTVGWLVKPAALLLARGALARQLARPTHRLGPLAGPALGRFFIGPAHFHLAEDALALHFLLKCAKRLIDVIVANQDLQSLSLSKMR